MRLHAIDSEVESTCASVCFVLLIGFLKKDLDKQKNVNDMAFGSFACNYQVRKSMLLKSKDESISIIHTKSKELSISQAKRKD